MIVRDLNVYRARRPEEEGFCPPMQGAGLKFGAGDELGDQSLGRGLSLQPMVDNRVAFGLTAEDSAIAERDELRVDHKGI